MNRLLMLLVLIPFLSRAQQSFDSTKFVYTQVNSVMNVSSRILQSRARLFLFMQNSDTSPQKTLFDDEGVIIFDKVAPAMIEIGGKLKQKGVIAYSVQITFRNGAYKIRIENCLHKANNADGGMLTNKVPDCGNSFMKQADWESIKRFAIRNIADYIKTIDEALTSDEVNPDSDSF